MGCAQFLLQHGRRPPRLQKLIHAQLRQQTAPVVSIRLTTEQIRLQLKIEVSLQQSRQRIEHQPCNHRRKGFRLRRLEIASANQLRAVLDRRVRQGCQTPGADQAVGVFKPQELLIALKNRHRIQVTGGKQLIRWGIQNHRFFRQWLIRLAGHPAAAPQALLQAWFQIKWREPDRHCPEMLLWLKLGARATAGWPG